MKLIPENVSCEACNNPATAELIDKLAGSLHRYCKDHKPDLWPGKNSHLELRRYRCAPGNAMSRLLSAPEDSAEHQGFRVEMCELKLLGAEGACLYYLSRLTDSDQFLLWSDEFLANAREFVVERTNGAAASIPFDYETVHAIASFFKRAFEERHYTKPSRQTKQERAVELFLHHPTWSDEEIAEEVPTTLKQLARNSNYLQLKRQLALSRESLS